MERKKELLRKFGKQLTALRKQKGLSVRELAIAAHLETRQVEKIEAGEVNLLLSTIVALAIGLGMSPETLFQSI